MTTIVDLNFYEPERIVVADVDSVRWFSDSHLLVPLRCKVDELPESRVGDWRLNTDMNEDGYYSPNKSDSDAKLERLAKAITPRNVDRQGLSLMAWPRDDSVVILYLRVLDAVLNRLILDTAEFIADRDVDGFGIADKPTAPVTLYAGDEVAGVMMPVRWSESTRNVIDLGRENATAQVR